MTDFLAFENADEGPTAAKAAGIDVIDRGMRVGGVGEWVEDLA
ncbi:beta-phosphoglucomutase-like phosphatase (HAD superfamily) [Kitasatospora sp. MAA19]|nr:hypothetical protein [Kitasatospora sp. MAA19]MDH6708274.1 beta-phosphoglucomutase-like phosphatase (HAD superfamily) [Kitasatospora sp. MAA19]